ncbi:hypothetical protein TVAGG3_0722970, partial [Trichomonas vaginalis G3]
VLPLFIRCFLSSSSTSSLLQSTSSLHQDASSL